MTIPQTVLDYKQALSEAVLALDWPRYQTILQDYQDYHASVSSKPFLLPHSSRLLIYAIEGETSDLVATNKSNIIKSLIQLGGLSYRQYVDNDHSQIGDVYIPSVIFNCACWGDIDTVKPLLAAGCQVEPDKIFYLIQNLRQGHLPHKDIAKVLLLLRHSQFDFSWLFTDGVIDGQAGVKAYFNRHSQPVNLTNNILPNLIRLNSDRLIRAFLIEGFSVGRVGSTDSVEPTRPTKAGPVVLHTLEQAKVKETINMLIELGLIDDQVLEEYFRYRGEKLSLVTSMLTRSMLTK